MGRAAAGCGVDMIGGFITVFMALQLTAMATAEGTVAYTNYYDKSYNPTPPDTSSPVVPSPPPPSTYSPSSPAYSPPYSPTPVSSSQAPAYSPPDQYSPSSPVYIAPAPYDQSSPTTPAPYSPAPQSPAYSAPSPTYYDSPPSPSTTSPVAAAPGPSSGYGYPSTSPTYANPPPPDCPPLWSTPSSPAGGDDGDDGHGSSWWDKTNGFQANQVPVAEVNTYGGGSDPYAGGATPVAPTDPYGGSSPGYAPQVQAPYASPSGGGPSYGPVAAPVSADPYGGGTPPATSPGTCSFWSLNTSMFPDFLTIFTTILDLFGGSSGSIFGSQMTLYQGLTSTRPDAYGSLLRQGSAAILNSYTSRSYPYTPFQVKSQFRSALVSQQAAAVMAVNFENANHGYSRRN